MKEKTDVYREEKPKQVASCWAAHPSPDPVFEGEEEALAVMAAATELCISQVYMHIATYNTICTYIKYDVYAAYTYISYFL